MTMRKPGRMHFWRRYGWVVAGVLAVTAVSAAITLVVLPPAPPADAPLARVYKNPTCQCCTKWVRHLQRAGFAVTTEHPADLAGIRTDAGVPSEYAACHTAVIEGYVIEGHVPAADIKRLLAERPAARGLAVPGMPVGSPGMEGPDVEDYRVYLLQADGSASVYSQHTSEEASAK